METKNTGSVVVGVTSPQPTPQAIADIRAPSTRAVEIPVAQTAAAAGQAATPATTAAPIPARIDDAKPQIHSYIAPPPPPATPIAAPGRRRRNWLIIGASSVIALSIGVFIVFRIVGGQHAPAQSGESVRLPLAQFEGQLPISTAPTVSVNGQLKVSSGLVIDPSLRPNNAVAGQLYYDKLTNQMQYYNGTDFVALLGGSTTNTSNTTINGAINAVTSSGGTINTLAKFVGGRAVGDSSITDDGTNVTVDGNLNLINTTPTADVTLWSPTDTPTFPSFTSDHAAVEIGTKFQTDVDGIVRGIRFYKGPTNTGTHIGNLWSSTGTLLASVTFGSETATGWQEARFSNPVAITAGSTYVISYHTQVGQYAADLNYFKVGGLDKPPLHALQEGADGPNGVFKYGASSSFPNGDSTGTNYWVDAIFSPSASPRHFEINGAQISSTALSNNYDLAKRSTGQVFSGINTFRNATDSEAGFVVQSADTTNLLVADTGAKTIVIKKARVTGDLLVDGHLVASAPDSSYTPAIVAGPAACTTPTVSVSGTDLAGVITVTAGTGCATNGKVATLTFHAPFDNPPRVILTPANGATSTLAGIYVDSSGTTVTTFDVTLGSGNLTNTTTYKWYYMTAGD